MGEYASKMYTNSVCTTQPIHCISILKKIQLIMESEIIAVYL